MGMHIFQEETTGTTAKIQASVFHALVSGRYVLAIITFPVLVGIAKVVTTLIAMVIDVALVDIIKAAVASFIAWELTCAFASVVEDTLKAWRWM